MRESKIVTLHPTLYSSSIKSYQHSCQRGFKFGTELPTILQMGYGVLLCRAILYTHIDKLFCAVNGVLRISPLILSFNIRVDLVYNFRHIVKRLICVPEVHHGHWRWIGESREQNPHVAA